MAGLERALRMAHALRTTSNTDDALYRGESRLYDGPIKSRMLRKWPVDRTGLEQATQTILREAAKRVDYTGDTDRLLTECQHMGVPMNAIDFTESPEVALWFASSDHTTDGRVLVAERQNLESTGATVLTERYGNHRADAQAGVLVCPPDGYIKPKSVRRISIPKNMKTELRTFLAALCGIDESRLFCDLHAFAQAIQNDEMRLIKAIQRAAWLAARRGDVKNAIELYESAANSHIAERPKDYGGHFNRTNLANLALLCEIDGQPEKSLEAKRMLQALESGKASRTVNEIQIDRVHGSVTELSARVSGPQVAWVQLFVRNTPFYGQRCGGNEEGVAISLPGRFYKQKCTWWFGLKSGEIGRRACRLGEDFSLTLGVNVSCQIK